MNPREELKRRALLHDQAAFLLMQDVTRHRAEARKLRKEVAKDLGRDLWVIIKQTPLRFSRWRLERKIDRGWDLDLSRRIDQIITRLEESRQ